MALPTADEISARLFAAAEARAQQYGLRLGEGADRELKSMAQTGTKEILVKAKDKKPEHAEEYFEPLFGLAQNLWRPSSTK
jgi:hypothetical protein